MDGKVDSTLVLSEVVSQPATCIYEFVNISCDPKKREATLKERGLDFVDAMEVFEGEIVFEAEDDRRDYGEVRIITVGFLRGRMVVVGWTARGTTRHVFTMRKANDREQARFRK